MHHEIIIAGFGGQGIMSAGSLLAYAAMMEGRFVTWYPAYGPEKRGGTAASHIIISDEPIGSPILTSASSLIVMNKPALDKFEGIVKKDGIIICDSSIVQRGAKRDDVEFYGIPATKYATDLGNINFANVVLIGKLLKRTGVTSKESLIDAIKKVLSEKKHYMIPDEIKAIEMGMEE